MCFSMKTTKAKSSIKKAPRPKVTVSLSEKVEDMLKKIMNARGYDNTSAFMSELIRNEFDRRKDQLGELADKGPATVAHV